MDAQEIEQLLRELDVHIDRLRAQYEQYFLGFERLEPLSLRKEVTRRLTQLQTIAPRNTAQRFRLSSLQQKLLSYQTYWNRTCRQIEEGSYRRHVARLRESDEPEWARAITVPAPAPPAPLVIALPALEAAALRPARAPTAAAQPAITAPKRPLIQRRAAAAQGADKPQK